MSLASYCVRAGICPLAWWSSGIRLDSREEATDRDGIEMEHFRPRKLPAVDLIQAENGAVASLSAPTHPSLPPQDHDLLVGRGDDAWVHLLFGGRGLERDPPGHNRALLAQAGHPGVGQGWGPAELDIGLTELGHSLRIPPLDRGEDLEQHIDILLCTHHAVLSVAVCRTWRPTMRSRATCATRRPR